MSYQNLKAEMKRHGVTQAQVAEFLGMSTNNFGLKVNERIPMTVEEAKAVQARFFPLANLDYLLESDGNVASAKEQCHAQVDTIRDVFEAHGWLDEGTEADFAQMHECVDGMIEEADE